MARVSYLNLHTLIPQRDVRKLIYAKLTRHEFFTVCVAHGRSLSFPVKFADHCAENGYLELLQWAIEKKCVHNSRIYYYAARNGHLKLLQWFWEESSNRGVIGMRVLELLKVDIWRFYSGLNHYHHMNKLVGSLLYVLLLQKRGI